MIAGVSHDISGYIPISYTITVSHSTHRLTLLIWPIGLNTATQMEAKMIAPHCECSGKVISAYQLALMTRYGDESFRLLALIWVISAPSRMTASTD